MTVAFVYVFFITCLGCQEYHVCQYLSVCFSLGVADYASTILVFVHGGMSCCKGCDTCYTVIIRQCKGFSHLEGVFRPYVKVEHEFIDCVYCNVRNEEVVHVDYLFGYRGVVAAEDWCSSFVVSGTHTSCVVEGGRFAVFDCSCALEVFEEAFPSHGVVDFAGEFLHKEGSHFIVGVVTVSCRCCRSVVDSEIC